MEGISFGWLNQGLIEHLTFKKRQQEGYADSFQSVMNEDAQSHLRMEATDRLNGLGGRRRRPKKVNTGFTLNTCSVLM